MKKRRLVLFVILAASGASFFAIPTERAADWALRYLAATDAFTAKLREAADEPVSSLDVNLDATAVAPEPAKAGESFSALDQRKVQVRVRALVTKRFDATATLPARNEILDAPTIFTHGDNPMVFTLPGNYGPTRIELRIKSTSR